MIRILGIKITDRIKEAGLTQGILSKHASVITTRLGFHEVTDEVCSREAYIITHLNCSDEEYSLFKTEITEIGGIELREMIFHDGEEPGNVLKDGQNVEILGILLKRDQATAVTVQKILTSYGCNIRTRLGVNEISLGQPAGLIILELRGDVTQRLLLEKDLKKLQNVTVRTMVF